MVKDTKTGEIFRTDHLVEAVLEARLKGDREARGQAAIPEVEDDKKKKKKKVVKSTAVKLEDATVQEYESLLAQVSDTCFGPTNVAVPGVIANLASSRRSTTLPALNSERSSRSTPLSTQRLATN